MAETRQKLDPVHRSFNKTGAAGFLILGLGTLLWLVVMAWNPSTNSQADYAGLAFITVLLMLLCIIIGGLISFGTLCGGNGVDCHCAKCCGNSSEDGLYCNGHSRLSSYSYDTAEAREKLRKLAEERRMLEEEKQKLGKERR